jgi:hypothetical protein
MAAILEFRDDLFPNNSHESQYDFVVENPAILTIEVGEPNQTPYIFNQQKYVRKEELDSVLQQYEVMIDEAQKESPFAAITLGSSANVDLTIELSENSRHELIDRVNQSFDLFLSYVQNQAKDFAKVLFKDQHFEPLFTSKEELLQLLSTADISVDDWRRKLVEIQSFVKMTEVQDFELKQQLDRDVESQPPSVASYLAKAINTDLDKSKAILLQDVNITYHAQQYKNNLLKKMTISYITFYSWILEQWNRNMKEINQAYGQMHDRIQQIWEKDKLNKDIEQLLSRYESFLKAHESRLPMEFTLSMNPRKEWREYMAKQQPQDCIRLMKNELQALSGDSTHLPPEMKKSLDVWNRELDRYDTDKVRKLNENRQRIRKRIEDAIEIETKQTCVKKWRELTERIFKMGTDLQTQAYLKIKEYDAQYFEKQEQLLRVNASLQKTIASYEGRLALVEKPWAAWMEKRKHLIRSIAQHNYWQVSIASLLEVYDIVQEFRQYIEKQQQSKI